MTVPKVRATTVLLTNGGATTVTVPVPQGTQEGDLLVVLLGAGGTPTLTDIEAKGWWTPVLNYSVNTRRMTVAIRRYSLATPYSDYVISLSTAVGVFALSASFYDHNVTTLSDVLVGPVWYRGNQAPVNRGDITMPSVTPTVPSLALAIMQEATTAAGPWSYITQNGFNLLLEKTDQQLSIEWGSFFTKELAAPTASGDVSVMFAANTVPNGAGLQLGIPGGNLPLPVGVPMPTAPAYVGTSSGTSITIPKPTNLVDGDLLIAAVRSQGLVPSGGEVAIPAGWARGGDGGGNGSADRAQGLFYKPIPSAAAETAVDYTFGNFTSARSLAAIFVVKNVDLSSPVGGGDSYGNTTTAEYTVTKTPYLALTFAGEERTAGLSYRPETTAPGFTHMANFQNTLIESTASSRTTAWLGYNPIYAGGSLTVAAHSTLWTAPSTANRISSIALNGFAPVGLVVKKGDGSRAYASMLNGASERVTPTSLRIWNKGLPNVAAMLATPGTAWAHRGGSANYAEMSEYAYDQSVMRGFSALEMSCQRSSDGVWFGMHDPTFDASAGVTGSPNANTLTWAQIQATYNNVLRPIPGWPSRPYFRLDAFLAKYGKTHLLILDPKNSINQNPNFLDVVDASGVDKSRLIWKFTGASSAGALRAQEALNRGWAATWGYFYATDVDDGGFATWAGNPAWTTIGMDINAAQSYWDTALAVGKPVVGHIASTQLMYDTAIAKGATMVQCSGSGVIAPVPQPGAQPTPVFISARSAEVPNTINNIAIPAGAIAGDAIFLCVNAGNGTSTVITAAEFTTLVPTTIMGTGSFWAGWKILSASDITAGTVNYNNSAGGYSTYATTVYRGVTSMTAGVVTVRPGSSGKTTALAVPMLIGQRALVITATKSAAAVPGPPTVDVPTVMRTMIYPNVASHTSLWVGDYLAPAETRVFSDISSQSGLAFQVAIA